MDLKDLLESIEPGTTLRLSVKDQEYMVVEMSNGRIDLKILDIEGVKSMVPKSDSKRRGIRGFVDLAKRLEEKECTLNVFHKDKMVMCLGKDVKPGLLTFLGPIQVLDLRTLTKLIS